jgi:hypothetical protein
MFQLRMEVASEDNSVIVAQPARPRGKQMTVRDEAVELMTGDAA